MARRSTEKRDRLVTAAMEQFHAKGIPRTSLADVARTAAIPIGNVFYYFKAKDDLVRAVVDETCRQLSGYLEKLETVKNRRSRIKAFIDQAAALAQMYIAHGCPLAALSRDLRSEGPGLSAEANRIYAVQEQWLKTQFVAMGFSPSKARVHTRFLMAGYHGAISLAYSQGEQDFITSEVESLKRWLRQLDCDKRY